MEVRAVKTLLVARLLCCHELFTVHVVWFCSVHSVWLGTQTVDFGFVPAAVELDASSLNFVNNLSLPGIADNVNYQSAPEGLKSFAQSMFQNEQGAGLLALEDIVVPGLDGSPAAPPPPPNATTTNTAAPPPPPPPPPPPRRTATTSCHLQASRVP